MPPKFKTNYVPLIAGSSQMQMEQVSMLLSAHIADSRVPLVSAIKEEYEESAELLKLPERAAQPVAKTGLAVVVIPVSKTRQRPIKLTEMARQLTPETNQSMALSALNRILKSERTAIHGGVASVRQKIISSLATMFSQDFSKSQRISRFLIEYFLI